jgi:hypothetical protein
MEPQLQQSGIFVLVIFLAVLAERGWQWMRRRAARAWPVAQGRIHSADWRQPRTGTNRYFIADVSFYYFVDGHFYSGYHRRSFSSADDAAQWTKSIHGLTVEVRYNAQSPAHAVLLDEDVNTQIANSAELVRGA